MAKQSPPRRAPKAARAAADAPLTLLVTAAFSGPEGDYRAGDALTVATAERARELVERLGVARAAAADERPTPAESPSAS